MKKIIILAGMLLTLAACSDSEESTENQNTANDGNQIGENNAVDHGIEDKSVGFSLDSEGNIAQAEVPEQEKTEIIEAFDEYIAAFNAEDIDRYMKIIAEEPDSFDRETDKAELEKAFEAYDTTYETSNVTIVEYTEERAEVFAEIAINTVETSTDRSAEQSGRQVVVFKKEDGEWKVTSLHFIGNQ